MPAILRAFLAGALLVGTASAQLLTAPGGGAAPTACGGAVTTNCYLKANGAGAVAISNALLGTDISTPTPDASKTQFYPKGGKWCAQSIAGVETCTGGSANAVLNNQANTYSTGLQDFSGASIKLPSAVTVGANSITFPSVSATLATLGANTFTGAQTATTFTLSSAGTVGITSGPSIAFTNTNLNLTTYGGFDITMQANHLLVGGITEGNFFLDVQKSGSSGTIRAYDQTATTGVTQLVCQDGAGQSTTACLQVKNNAGTTNVSLSGNGNIVNAGVTTSGGFGMASSRNFINAPSDGIITVQTFSGGSFTRLQFGGTGATGPALTTTIQTNPILKVTDATGGDTAQFAVGTLKTTGSAAGKKQVCVDTATGILYASSTAVDCSN